MELVVDLLHMLTSYMFSLVYTSNNACRNIYINEYILTLDYHNNVDKYSLQVMDCIPLLIIFSYLYSHGD